MIEFGCFACPFTKQAQPALREFLASNPNVRLEFRSFPIPAHAFSREAAEAAFCAEEQGEDKFWAYHDLLFESQNRLSLAEFKALARRAGLGEAKFGECFDSKKYASKVERNLEEGKNAGVYGTPTFFFPSTGSVLVGPKSVSEFEGALKEKVVASEEGGACPPPAQPSVQN